MSAGTKFVGFVRRLNTRLRARGLPRNHLDEEPPLRSELFSADQMELHGKALAASHKLAPGRATDRLLARLAASLGDAAGVRVHLTEGMRGSARARLIGAALGVRLAAAEGAHAGGRPDEARRPATRMAVRAARAAPSTC